MHSLFFLFFSVGAVGSALVAITRRNAVYSALWVLGAFGSISGIFVLLDAPLLAIFNLLLYAGAVIVLFLFVIMLLDLKEARLETDRGLLSLPGGAFVALVLFGLIAVGILKSPTLAAPFPEIAPAGEAGAAAGKSGAAAPRGKRPAPAPFGDVKELGKALFQDHVVPFEAASILLLVAILGAVFLGKRRLDNEGTGEG